MSRMLPRHTQSRSKPIKKLTTVTSGTAASDAALVAKFLAKDTVPGDFDASALALAEIPEGLLKTFSKPPITGPLAFTRMVLKRKQYHRNQVATYGMMASEQRGWQEFADNQGKVVKEFRVEACTDYEWICVRSPRVGTTDNFWGRRCEQWTNVLPGVDDPHNVNLHVGANGRVPGQAAPNRLSIVGFLVGTPTKAGKDGIVTAYQKKKAEKVALDPAKVLLFLISHSCFLQFSFTFCLVQAAAVETEKAAVKAEKAAVKVTGAPGAI